MTKVILSESVLKYRREMAEAVSESIKAGFIDGVKTFHLEEPLPVNRDLLLPPKIEIERTFYKGNIDDQIFLATTDVFGVWNVHVVIRDDQGLVFESGDAVQFEDCPGCWDYVAAVSVPSGTRLTISAAATDQFWNVGAASAVLTIGEF